MNKSDFAAQVAARASLSRSRAGNVVNAAFDCITDALPGGKRVTIAGFGTFSTRSRPARRGRTPRTGEVIDLAAATAPTFKPSKTVRDAVNRARMTIRPLSATSGLLDSRSRQPRHPWLDPRIQPDGSEDPMARPFSESRARPAAPPPAATQQQHPSRAGRTTLRAPIPLRPGARTEIMPMKTALLLASLALAALLAPAEAHAQLDEDDLKTITTAVREICQHPDRRGSVLTVKGEAEAGVIVKFVGGEISGTIEKTEWEGINQEIDRYKTDPRKCADSVLGKLLNHFSPRDVDITPLSREISFRVKQVDKVLDNVQSMDWRDAEAYCDHARSVVVVLELGGILHFPPPNEEESVWIGSSGYGYRHIPFRSGYKLKEFERHSLRDLLLDLAKQRDEYTPNVVQLDDLLMELDERIDLGKEILRGCKSTRKSAVEGWVKNTVDVWGSVKNAGLVSSIASL